VAGDRDYSSDIEAALAAAAAAAEAEDGAPPPPKKRKAPAANAPSGLPRVREEVAASETSDSKRPQKTPTLPPARYGRGLSIPGISREALEAGAKPSPAPSKESAPPAAAPASMPGNTRPPSPSSDDSGRTREARALRNGRDDGGGGTGSIRGTPASQLRGTPAGSISVPPATKSLTPPPTAPSPPPYSPPSYSPPGKALTPSQSLPRPGAKPRALEMIDYAPDEPLIDHKGRSKPLYKPRTPKPNSWRPRRPIRLLLGLFPGARVMALESTREGVPYAIFGLLTLLATILLVIGYGRTIATVHQLMIDDRALLVYAGAICAMLIVYEILRLASFFEEHPQSVRGPRVLAALLSPALMIIVFGPDLIGIWPQTIELGWFASVVVAVGALGSSIWCALDGTLSSPRARLWFRLVGVVAIVLLVAGAVLTDTFGPSSLRAVASFASGQGFRTLPEILRSI
jgi:hypothetical protein